MTPSIRPDIRAKLTWEAPASQGSHAPKRTNPTLGRWGLQETDAQTPARIQVAALMEPTTTALALTFASTALKAIKLAKAENEGEALEKLLGMRSDFSKLMPDSNDDKVNKEFAKQLQEMVLDHEAWKNYKESEKPAPEDVLLGFEKLKEAVATAGHPKKRKVLFNAFFNSFKPEFYNEGLSNILWAKVEKLEYPDFAHLKKIVDGQNPSTRAVVYLQDGPDYEYTKRLEEHRLVQIGEPLGNGSKVLFSIGIAGKLAEFALEEFWKPEPSAT